MINRVTLVGRLGADVDIRYTPKSGTPVTKLRIATDSSHRNAAGERVESTEWHSVIVYGRSAENCAAYIGKGSLVYVEGFLKTRKWMDQQRIERYSTEVVCRQIRFLDRRPEQQAAVEPDPLPPLADDGAFLELGIDDMRD